MAKTGYEKLDNFLPWMLNLAKVKETLKPGETTTYKCTCGGTVTAVRAERNGHIHAGCDKCKTVVVE